MRVASPQTLSRGNYDVYADTEGDIVMITSMPGVASLDQRARGFKEAVAARYRALDITADKVGDGKPATALNIMRGLIANTADLRGVSFPIRSRRWPWAKPWSKRNRTTRSMSSALARTKKLVKLLQDGVIAGLVVEDPFRMGYDGVKTALAASKG